MRSGWRGFWRLLRLPLVAALALLLWFEEWGWRPLAAWLGRLARWPPLARLEARVGRASPRVALALFLAPTLALLPVKLLALALLNRGQTTLGLAVIVVAKLLGTALLGRLFVLTEPQLRRYAWVARAFDAWADFKHRLRAWVERQAVWQQMRRARLRLVRRVRVWWRGSAG